jgi:hypothetical protein
MTFDFIQQTIEELCDKLRESSQNLGKLKKARKPKRIRQEVVSIIEKLRQTANDLQEDLEGL